MPPEAERVVVPRSAAPTVPVPPVIATVIEAELPVIRLPTASSTRTVGCVVKIAFGRALPNPPPPNAPVTAPAGSVPKASATGASAATVKAFVSAEVKPGTVAVSTKFAPASSMRRSVNVATPAFAVTVVVPWSVAPPTPVPSLIATVTSALVPVSRLPSASVMWKTGCTTKSSPAVVPPGWVSTWSRGGTVESTAGTLLCVSVPVPSAP